MFTEWFLKEAKKKDIKLHNIFDADVKALTPDHPGMLSDQHKFLPKNASSQGAIDVFGEYIVTFSGMAVGTISDDITVFVIASKELADGYRKWWKTLWSL